VAVDPNRVEHAAAEGRRGARTSKALLSRLGFHLSGAQLGITVTSLLVGVVAEPSVARLLEPILEPLVGAAATAGASLALAIAIATIVQMIVGELVPKGLAIARPETTTFLLAPGIRVYGLIFGPLIRLLDGAASRTVRLLGVEPAEELSRVRTLPELKALVEASREEGTLEEGASELLTRTIRFEGKVAEDVLIARTAVAALPRDASIADLAQIAVISGHSRFPVYGEDLDEILGVVHVREVHGVAADERGSTPLLPFVASMVAIPESRDLAEVLIDLRREHAHLAVVVDEYGGTAGIITLEDILEEIVGEIADEHDPRDETPSRVTAEGEWILSGTLHPDELADATKLEIPEGEYETLAGFMLDRLGHIPGAGEVVSFEGWLLRVEAMDRRRIAEVRVQSPMFAGERSTITTPLRPPSRRAEQ
jgi:CBS domain containing-hemolysin-like protein